MTLETNTNVPLVSWSPNSTQLASADDQKQIKIWNPTTSQCIATLIGHEGWVLSVAWSPNSALIASGSHDKTIKVWDVAQGRCIATLVGHKDGVNSVAWSPNSALIASGSYDNTIKVWDVAAIQSPDTRLEHPDNDVDILALSTNARFLALATKETTHNNTVKILDLRTGECTATLKGHSRGVGHVTWSPSIATQLATIAVNNTVRIWDVATGRTLTKITGHRHEISKLAWSPDGARLALGSRCGKVSIWDTATGHRTMRLNEDLFNVSALAWSPDGTQLAIGSRGQVNVWDLTTGECTKMFQARSYISNIVWSSGMWLAVQLPGRIKIWPSPSGQHLMDVITHSPLLHFDATLSHQRISTNMGTFDLPPLQTLKPSDNGSVPELHISSLRQIGYAFDSSRSWITYQGQKVLWLPKEYRPERVTISGEAMAFVTNDGRVVSFLFSTDHVPELYEEDGKEEGSGKEAYMRPEIVRLPRRWHLRSLGVDFSVSTLPGFVT
jgi:WD40 repeat protein